jgi:hypothetical protein
MHGLDDEEEALGHCENCLYVKKARVVASEKAKAKAEAEADATTAAEKDGSEEGNLES